MNKDKVLDMFTIKMKIQKSSHPIFNDKQFSFIFGFKKHIFLIKMKNSQLRVLSDKVTFKADVVFKSDCTSSNVLYLISLKIFLVLASKIKSDLKCFPRN